MARFSSDRHDPGYANFLAAGKVITVFIDGVKQHLVITADEDEGFIVRYALGADGKAMTDPKNPGQLLTERCAGKVVVEVAS